MIVTLTVNPCIDESTSVDRVAADHKLRCRAATYEPGGGGINVSRAIRRLGGDSLAIYPAGGPAGKLLGSLLDKEAVRHRPLTIASWTRENLNVVEEFTGRQFRFVLPGPTLLPEEWKACLDEVVSLRPAPSYVVASGSLPPGVPPDFYAKLAREVRRAGARFALDAAGGPAGLALDEGVFLFKPSLREFQVLSGLKDATESQLAGRAKDWVAAGRCEVVVVSLGKAGALLAANGRSERLMSPTVSARSTVGAGDSMLAGIVLRLEQGWPLREAARFGLSAAAATVMNPGTQLCRQEDAERLYEELAVPVSA